MYESVDTLSDCIQIAAGCLATLKLRPEAMRASLSADMLVRPAPPPPRVRSHTGSRSVRPSVRPSARLPRPPPQATDLAEYLVRKGVPFRETHHISGAAVRLAEQRACPLSALSVADLAALHPAFSDDVAALWSFDRRRAA